MKIITNNSIVVINKVYPNDFNPKPDYKNDPEAKKQYENLVSSLRQHGQVDPVLVREVSGKYELVNGYHRWNAMKDLGYKEIEIKNLGKVSREEAIYLAVSTEEIKVEIERTELGKLLAELSKYRSLEELLTNLPYTEAELNDLLKLSEFDWQQFENEEDAEDAFNKIFLKVELTDQQNKIIREAIKKAKDGKETEDGEALAIICGTYNAL